MVDRKVGGRTTREHSESRNRKCAESGRTSEAFPFGGACCVHGTEAGSTRTEQGALPSCAIDSFFAVSSPRLRPAAALPSRSRRAMRCRIRPASPWGRSRRSRVSRMHCRCRARRKTPCANGSFDWHLDAQSKLNAAAGFFTIISGNAMPSGQRHRGSGTFTIDLDAARNLSGHATDQGTIVITYSNIGPVHVQANFNNLISQDAQHLGDVGNAYYNYQQDITGGGDMEIAWHDVTNEERDDIHSRWKADGSGRADVTVVKPGANAQFSECWS